MAFLTHSTGPVLDVCHFLRISVTRTLNLSRGIGLGGTVLSVVSSVARVSFGCLVHTYRDYINEERSGYQGDATSHVSSSTFAFRNRSSGDLMSTPKAAENTTVPRILRGLGGVQADGLREEGW